MTLKSSLLKPVFCVSMSILMGVELLPVSVQAETETASPESEETETVSVSGSYVEMTGDQSSSLQIHLYQNGTAYDSTAATADTETAYADSAFEVYSYTFNDLPKTDDNGNEFSYTIQSECDSCVLTYMDSEHTALTADEHGNYPADGTVIAAVETSYISGVLERDTADTDLSEVTVKLNNDADVTLSMEDQQTEGTWTSKDQQPMFDAATGKAIEYSATVSSLPEGYTAYYDNSSVTGRESDEDCAYAGGSVQIAGTAIMLYGAQETEYTVNLTQSDLTASDELTISLDQAASVTIDGTPTAYDADQTFTVPATTTQFTFTSAAESVNLTIEPVSGIGVMPAYSAALTSESAATSFVLCKAAATQTLELRWLDGQVDKSSLTVSLGLQFKVGKGDWTDLTEANMGSLGYASLPDIPAHTGNDSTWSYAFNNVLITTDSDGNTVEYRLREANALDGYVASYSSDDTLMQYTLINGYSAVVKWADAGDEYNTRWTLEDWLASGIVLKRKTLNGTPIDITLSTDDETAEGYITITKREDIMWEITLSNARGYDENDSPYVYYIVENGNASMNVASVKNVTDNTVYTLTYQNENNYASITDGLYTGGKLTNTLSDTTTFTARKEWMDDGSDDTISKRPEAALTLYRYPADGVMDYSQGSPVAGVMDISIDKAKAPATQINITLPTSGTLPMFNEDGYKYVYYAKEKLSGDNTNTYKQVFSENGNEPGNDTLLFQGGMLKNTITGTVSATATKTWVAAARQDVNASITLNLKRTDHSGKSTVINSETITGFSTEFTSKTYTFAGLDEYDADGLKYTYSIEESTDPGKLTTAVGNGSGNVTFYSDNGTYFVTADGYRYQQATSVNDGVTTITNTLVGNAQVVIDKNFYKWLCRGH